MEWRDTMKYNRFLPGRLAALVLLAGLITRAAAQQPLPAPPVDIKETTPTVVRIYNVADLILPVPGSSGIDIRNLSKLAASTAAVKTTPVPKDDEPANASVPQSAPATTLEEPLMKLLTITVEPESWSEKGGAGSMVYHPQGMSLVINQTPTV